jgi:hypothetical protein
MFEKFMIALFFVAVGIGISYMLAKGLDGEMLVECHQMQTWVAEGHDLKVPEYCYDLGLKRR